MRLFRFPRRTHDTIATEVDAELRFHLDMRTRELSAGGMSDADARREAQREFGDVEFTRRYCRSQDEGAERSVRMSERWDELRQNGAYAVRTLRANPGFTTVALLTLALAIGANTAVFSVASAVLLQPLPYGRPDGLVAIYENNVPGRSERNELSAADFVDYRGSQRALSGYAAFAHSQLTLTNPASEAVLLQAIRISPNLFDVLQVGAWRGRTFAPDEDSPARKHVVILSYDSWQRVFGGDAAIVNRAVVLNRESYTVVGIMPRGVNLGYREDIWIPLDLTNALRHPSSARKSHYLYGIGRLKPGIGIADAQNDLLGIAHQLETKYPDANAGHLVTVLPLHTAMVGDLRPTMFVLGAAAALVLLIACANMANVTASRAISRRREMAVRAAIGAGRARLARQLLTESVLLAIAGGMLGLALAYAGTHFLLSLNPDILPPLSHVSLDSRVLAFGAAVSIGTGVLFGFLPALDGSRTDLHAALKESGRGASLGTRIGRLRRGLVVAQIALAVVLLVGAGLLIRSFGALQRVSLGWNPDRVLTAQLSVGGPRYDTLAVVNQFYDALLERLRTTPGVEAVGAVSALPLLGSSGCSMAVEGDPSPPSPLPGVRCLGARADYFRAMQTPLLRGRMFDATDRENGPQVVVINESMAKSFWPGTDALGKRLRLGPDSSMPWQTVIGVVADQRHTSLESNPGPTAFENAAQHDWGSLMLAIRTTGAPERAAPALRAAVRELDPTLAVRDVRAMADVLGNGFAARRFSMVLISVFAAVALALAAVGIYGVLAHAVASRTREFGIRLALGATRHGVLLLVLRQGIGWSVLGLSLGLLAAVASGRLIAGMLYGVQVTDAWTFALVAAGLLSIVLIACLIPARRATRADPIAALREE